MQQANLNAQGRAQAPDLLRLGGRAFFVEEVVMDSNPHNREGAGVA